MEGSATVERLTDAYALLGQRWEQRDAAADKMHALGGIREEWPRFHVRHQSGIICSTDRQGSAFIQPNVAFVRRMVAPSR